MMPLLIDSLPGVLQYTVVEEDIPGLLPLSFQEKQGALISEGTNKLHLPRIEAFAHMHRTSGGHRTIDVARVLPPFTFRVPDGIPQRYGLSWDQFASKSVPKTTRSNAEPAVKQPVDRYSSDGRDDSHFSQDVQGCETRSSFTQNDAGPHERRPTVSNEAVVVWHREEERRQLIKSNRSAGVAETSTCTHPASARQKGANHHARWENCFKCQQRLVTEKRDYWKEARLLREKALEKDETARRMEEQRTKSFRAPPRRHCPPARAPKASKLDPGAKSRTCGPAASRAAAASSDNHLEEVLKGQVVQG